MGLGTLTRLNVKLRSGYLVKTNYEESPLLSVILPNAGLACVHVKAFRTSAISLRHPPQSTSGGYRSSTLSPAKSIDSGRPQGLTPYDPNDDPSPKDLRTPFVPDKNNKSLWKQAKDGVKNSISTPEFRREVKHPSLFYRQDHKDIGHLYAATGLHGHSSYKGDKPHPNAGLMSLCFMALLVHLFTRDENDLDDNIKKQGWYRLLWMDKPYDSSKDPRSNKGFGKEMIGVPIIREDTLLNNSEDE